MKGKNSECDEVVETTSGVTRRDCAMGTKKRRGALRRKKLWTMLLQHCMEASRQAMLAIVLHRHMISFKG
jgi:hypothetical protein